MWDGRKEHPARANQLALLVAVVAGAICIEGLSKGWTSPTSEAAAAAGMQWMTVALGAGLAAAGTYLWAAAWLYASTAATDRLGEADTGPPHSDRPREEARRNPSSDRLIHAGLQGISAAAGAAATLLVIPGGSGVGIGGSLPPEVTAAVLEAIPPLGLVWLIAASVAAGSWWGWDKFGHDEGPAQTPTPRADTSEEGQQ